MTAEELFEKVKQKAVSFGMKEKGQRKANSVIRKYIQDVAFKEGEAYFGFIRSEEEDSGVYSDFSLVIFPDNPEDVKTCVVCLVVGSQGFKNDFQLAILPGIRRHFIQLADDQSFFKTDFSDIENSIPSFVDAIQDYEELIPVIKRYDKMIQAARICDLSEDDSLNHIYEWLAMYAKVRKWDKNKKGENHKGHNASIIKSLQGLSSSKSTKIQQKEVEDLLKSRRFVVLQGAPGTGKTWNALEIAKNYNKNFFVQFHAETTYSDFVDGIQPDLNNDKSGMKFTNKKGILCEALEYATANPSESVLLIIDEINRANLSNVLGPVFFLFENNASNRDKTTKIIIGGKPYDKIPDNLFVIATMNTADRSLAVVDFALRRRFAWYTLRPIILSDASFDKETFQKFADIFFDYASDYELNLQPGQSYFLNKNQKQQKLQYELMPLIKEYIEEGYLTKAKDEFSDLFFKEANVVMYE